MAKRDNNTNDSEGLIIISKNLPRKAYKLFIADLLDMDPASKDFDVKYRELVLHVHRPTVET